MPKVYYFDGKVDADSYKDFAESKGFDPRKSVFLFPSNTGHHTNVRSLYSRKSGAGLAKAADELYEHEIPCLGLPTTGMPANITLKDIQGASFPPITYAKAALIDIWAALGFGLDLVCPVRERRQNPQYFSEALTKGDKGDKEASFWGQNEENPNLELADYYHAQLKLIHSATIYQPEENKEGDADRILSFLQKNQEEIDYTFINSYKSGKRAAESLANSQDRARYKKSWWYQDPLTWNVPETKEFAEGFKKIYTALREGQSGFDCFKTNFIAGKEHLKPEGFIKEIKKHANESPNSRTAKALELAKYYFKKDIPDSCTSKNGPLFKDIYLAAFAASRPWCFGLFKRSKITGKTIYKISTLETALEGKQMGSPTNLSSGSRTGKINTALNR
jgi:hypothetical protein